MDVPWIGYNVYVLRHFAVVGLLSLFVVSSISKMVSELVFKSGKL